MDVSMILCSNHMAMYIWLFLLEDAYDSQMLKMKESWLLIKIINVLINT